MKFFLAVGLYLDVLFALFGCETLTLKADGETGELLWVCEEWPRVNFEVETVGASLL